MSKELQVSFSELVPRAMTRTRGREAAEELRRRADSARASRIILNMNSDSLVTGSVVDEFVQQAARWEGERGPQVVFLIPDKSMLEKFKNSVTWRQLSCHYRDDSGDRVKTLRPTTPTESTPPAIFASKEDIPL